VPEELLSDNGKVFTGRFGPNPGEVLFDRICRENGITHRLTAPRSPTTTGKIERFHKTLREELLASLPPFPSLEVAQQVIDDWVCDYNTRRPHQALAMGTPVDRFHCPARAPCRRIHRCWWPTSSAPGPDPTEGSSRWPQPPPARSPGWSTATGSSP
jgi:hypothetical protein